MRGCDTCRRSTGTNSMRTMRRMTSPDHRVATFSSAAMIAMYGPARRCKRPSKPKKTLEGRQLCGRSAPDDEDKLPSRREKAIEGEGTPRSANDVMTISSSSS